MIKLKDVRKILSDNNVYMGQVRGYKEDKIILVRCQWCGDSPKNPLKCHLQITQRYWKGKKVIVWRCARCAECGHVSKLFDKLGIDFDQSKYIAYESFELLKNFKHPDVYSIKKVFELDTGKSIERIDKRKLISMVRAPEINDFTKSIINYLVNKRCYSSEYISDLLRLTKLSFCDNILIKGDSELAPLFERILFFSYNNILVQGRIASDYGKRYYIYRKTEDVSDVIAFEGIGSIVLLVEGPFDAMRVNSYGYPVISLQGKNIGNLVSSFRTFEKTRKLFSKYIKIILCFDNEILYEDLEKYCQNLLKSGVMNNNQMVGYIKMYETEYGDIDNVIDEDEFEKILKTKVAFFSSLDRVGNTFKKFMKGIDESR